MASSLTYRSDEAVLRETAQAEPARVQPSPAARGLFRLAQLGAFVSALADIYRVALWGDNSALSFYITGLSFAALLPVALAIHELLRNRFSEIMLAVGAATFLRYVIIGALVAQGIISTRQETLTLHYAWATYAAWLLISNVLLWRAKALPRLVISLALVAGALFAGAELAWAQIRFLDWRADPTLVPMVETLQVRGNALSLAGYTVMPIWLVGLTIALGFRIPTTVVGIHRAIVIEPLLLIVLLAPSLSQRPPELAGFDAYQYLTGYDDYQCTDFRSQAEAQAVLRADPSDPNRLASTRGLACENSVAPFDWIPVRVHGPDVEPLYAPTLVGRGNLAFVALDDFYLEVLSQLVERQESRFGFSITVLPPLHVPWPDDRRSELAGEELIARLRSEFPTLATDRSTTIIAFTTRPLHQWGQAGEREHVYAHNEDKRLGVITSWDMEVDSRGQYVDKDRFMSRMDKYTTRYVGNLYFRIPRNDDPQSLFSKQVRGMADVDRWRGDIRRE